MITKELPVQKLHSIPSTLLPLVQVEVTRQKEVVQLVVHRERIRSGPIREEVLVLEAGWPIQAEVGASTVG